jgi:hypothetical protein
MFVIYSVTNSCHPVYSSRNEIVRSTSVRSKRHGDRRGVGGIVDMEAYTVQTKKHYFPAVILCSSLSRVMFLTYVLYAFVFLLPASL